MTIDFLNGAFFCVIGFWFFVGMLVKMGAVIEAVDKQDASNAAGYMVAVFIYAAICVWAGLAGIEWWAP